MHNMRNGPVHQARDQQTHDSKINPALRRWSTGIANN